MTAPVQPPASRRNRWVLFALIAVTVAPVLASYLTYYLFKPTGGKTYGELLQVQPVPSFSMQTLDGKAKTLADFKGKWLLLIRDKAACPADCQASLFAMRQIRLAQGAEMDRVERLWLISDLGQPSAQAIKSADGAKLLRSEQLPLPGDIEQGIYLIDPLGNQVLRYPRQNEPVKIIRELTKLLKNNQNIG